MSHMVLPKAKELMLSLACGSGSLPSGTLKQALLRLDGTLTDTYAQTVTGATTGPPILLTTALGAVTTVGDRVVVSGVAGTIIGPNGTYRAYSGSDSTHVAVRLTNGGNTLGVGSYTAGGMIINLSKLQYLSQIDGCIVGTPVAISSTFTNGVLNTTAGASVTHSSVPVGWVHAYIIYLDTGVASTSPVLFFSDCRQHITNMQDVGAGATAMITGPQEGPIPAATVLQWSMGRDSVVSAQSTPNLEYSSLAVNSLASNIDSGSVCDAPWVGASLPVYISTPGSIIITPDPGGSYVSEPVGWFEI